MSAPTPQNAVRNSDIPGRITFLEGNGDLPKLDVTTDHGEAEVYLQGAHVTSFQLNGQPPLLFTSQCSRFQVGQPIRGGIPIIFPWFGPREGEPAHGFARVTDWALHEASSLPKGGVSLRFGMLPNPVMATWPPLSLVYAVTITDRITIQLITTNLSKNQPLVIEDCLHTYFHVGDIHETRVKGLKGTRYLDKVDSFAAKVEAQNEIAVTGETDRVYEDTEATVEIIDPTLGRRIVVEKSGSRSTVVWNPWIGKAQQMPDFGNDEYLRMICVESGNVGRNKITLAPGESHEVGVMLRSEPLI